MTTTLILLMPLLFAVLNIIFRSRRLSVLTLILHPVILLSGVTYIYSGYDVGMLEYFAVDSTNILFLFLLGAVYLPVSFASLVFLKKENIKDGEVVFYNLMMILFAFAMTGAILSTHLGMFWVFIELTTLASAPLIYFEKRKGSLEATWKYVFICSVGIALAFIGIIFFTLAGKSINSLFFADLVSKADQLSPFWLKFAFPFILAGFGTKAGLAPMHAWLPDAHSEAPAPVSALLSGMLLNSAFLGIMRVDSVMTAARLDSYSKPLLGLAGFLSLFVCAVYILKVKNYKRMLAYSSIENMGIIAIGFSLGKGGIFAAMLHMVGHSFAKTAFFLTSGNIVIMYGTKLIENVKGILVKNPKVGWMWIFSFLMITAIPPSPLFISEFMIVSQLINDGKYFHAFFLFVSLTIIVFGMGKVVIKLCSGKPSEYSTGEEISFIDIIPQILLIIILIITGINMPHFLYSLLQGVKI